MTIAITSSGIALDGPLVAGEKVAVSVSGVTFAEDAKPTLCLLGRFPDALLSSVELAEDENTPGTWTGRLDTATKQTAVFFATARADECRDAVLELVAARQSVARLMVAFRNSALCPSPFHAPDASPVYIPVPGPPGQGGDPYDQNPAMDGVASAGVSDKYARGDHTHPTDTSRASAADVAAIQNIIPSTATPSNKLATAADIPAAQVNADWNAVSGVAQILNKPTIPAAQVQSNWNETNTSSKAYIQNKPGHIVEFQNDNNGGSDYEALTIGNRYSGSLRGQPSLAVGNNTKARGINSFAQGYSTDATADNAHAEGKSTSATNYAAHAEGNSTTASGNTAHAEGNSTTASGNTAHAEGYQTTAAGNISHSEGISTYAAGRPSHAEGSETTAAGIASHADGYRAVTATSGNGSGASTPHDYAFAWQGVSTGGYYRSHGAGTYNVNPVGGIGGFYVGEQSLGFHVNALPYASTTTLAPETAVYRATATLSGTTATMPTVTITGIPTAAAYFAFELEVAVDATATALDDTAWSGWTWMDGGELPTADYAGKTLFIACRLDCTARTIKANCYEVA